MARTILERLLGYESYDEGRDPLDTGFGNIEPKRQGVAEFGKGLLDMGGQAARGTAAGAIALPHDISTIGTALWQLQDDLPDRDKMNWWEAFGTRMANAEAAQPDWLPSYQDADQALPEFTPMSETFADYSEGNRPIETFSSMAFAPLPYAKAYRGLKAIPNPLREGGALNPKRVEGVVESPRIRLLEQQPEQAQLTAPQPKLPAPEPTSETAVLDELLASFDNFIEKKYSGTKPPFIDEPEEVVQQITPKQSVWDEFLPKADDMAEAGWKSKSVVVEFPIEDFLRLADEGKDKYKADRVAGFDQFETYPQLSFELGDDGIAQIVGHEGRHRARELLKRGHKTMPVDFRSQDGANVIRWSEQDNPEKYDYRDIFPKGIRGQSKSQAVKEGDPIRPFPVQRGQWGVLRNQTVPEPEIPDKPLSVSTFVQPDAIKLFAESGGAPAPSFGITRADATPEILSKFGDVQLIVNPERLRQGNYRIYGDDAYLGRAPELTQSYEPMDVALAMANDPNFARYKTEIPQFIQDFMAFDAQRLGVNTEGVRQDALSRAVKIIQQSAEYDRPLPDVAQAVIGYRTKDHLSSPGLRSVDAESRFVEMESGLPYDAEAALDKMMARDAQMRGSEFGSTQKHTPFQNLFAREFENLDEAAANRDVLRGPGERPIPKSEAQSDEFADLMARISEDFLGGEFRTKTVGRDVLEGRNIDQMLQKYNMKPEDIKTIKDKITNLQEKYKNQPKNYFEAKGDEVIKLEDFDAVVIDEMYTDAIKILEDAGVKKILTYGTPKERAEIFKKYPELLFSLMLVGLTGPALMQEQEQGDGS